MKEERFFYVPNAATHQELPADEARHATRVLRLQAGDDIFLMDGAGTFFKAVVTLSANHHCAYSITETLPQQKTWNAKITLAIAPTKLVERMEWMVEKTVEIGVDEIDFISCHFSARRELRQDRMERIAVAAMKQSRKPWLTTIGEMARLDAFLSQPRQGRKFIAHCYSDMPRQDLFHALQSTPQDENVTVLIGPEGDFSVDEVRLAESHGYTPVTLGQSRLRTETAGLIAVAMAQLTKRTEESK